MTKQLKYTGAFKLYLLMDELLASFPEWLVGEGEDRQCLLYLEGNEKGARLTVPDDADEEAIETVVLAHDPEKLTSYENVRNKIKIVAKSAEDVALNDLTQGQIKALLAVMLWKAGGVADDMTVKALGEWI